MAIRTRSTPRVTHGDWSNTSPGAGPSTTGPVPAKQSSGAGLAVIGLLAILDGAWGGIVPYLGPSFGYSSNGSGSFQWTLLHGLLYLLPGAAAVVAGFGLLSGLRGLGKAMGLLLVLCGAWFVVGVIAWPTLYSTAVFTSAPPDTNFVNILGYNVGPGLILAVLGGIALGAGRRA